MKPPSNINWAYGESVALEAVLKILTEKDDDGTF